MDVRRRGHQHGEARIEGIGAEGLRREEHDRQHPDRGGGHRRFREVDPEAVPAARAPRVVGGDPQILRGMPDRDPAEVVGALAPIHRVEPAREAEQRHRDRKREPEHLGEQQDQRRGGHAQRGRAQGQHQRRDQAREVAREQHCSERKRDAVRDSETHEARGIAGQRNRVVGGRSLPGVHPQEDQAVGEDEGEAERAPQHRSHRGAAPAQEHGSQPVVLGRVVPRAPGQVERGEEGRHQRHVQRDHERREERQRRVDREAAVEPAVFSSLVDTQQRRAVVREAHEQHQHRHQRVGLERADPAAVDEEDRQRDRVEQAAADQQIRERSEEPRLRAAGGGSGLGHSPFFSICRATSSRRPGGVVACRG